MKSYEISVIIPFYNTPYELFDNCLQSLLYQTFKNYELIIIDDGSEEYFAKYLDSKCEQLTNVRIFHIKNNGVSYARNFGLSKALGKFICFVDSDDYLASWAFEDLYKGICKYKADVCISYIKRARTADCSFRRNVNYNVIDMNEEKQKCYVNEIIMRGLNVIKNQNGFLSCGPCAILLKKEVARSYDFPYGIKYMEDVIWNYKVLNSTNIIVKLNEATYTYMYNASSATRKYEKHIIDDRIYSLLKIKEIIAGDEETIQWFGLRLLCNLSIICYQCGHIDSVKNIITAIKDAYNYLYREEWNILKRYGIDQNWELKYRFKLFLYKTRLLPLLLTVRQVINELRFKQ